MPTIIPLTTEAEWLEALKPLPYWDPSLAAAVVLSPHPDDETLGCGGMIARLRELKVPVQVVAITDGERAYADTENLGAVRVMEQIEALRRLGVSGSSIDRLQLPDSEVARYEEELVHLVLPLVSEGTQLFAPWPHDFHPDHEVAGRAAQRIARLLGVDLTFYIFWAWHRGTPKLLKSSRLVKVPLTRTEQTMKLHALKAHVSQLEHADGEPVLSAELLKPAHWPFEVYIR